MNEVSSGCYGFMLKLNYAHSDFLRMYAIGERFDYERDLLNWGLPRSDPYSVFILRTEYKQALQQAVKCIDSLRDVLTGLLEADYMKETIEVPNLSQETKSIAEFTNAKGENA